MREYNYSKNMKTSGRLFSNGVQNIGREIRGFLMSHTTDIDMKNAHPVILRYICKKHNILSRELDYYVENRDNILTSIPNTTKDEAKTMFLVALNNDKINKHSSHPVFRKFDNESKILQKAVSEIPEYKTLCDSVPLGKETNVIGSKLNRILCHYENEILQVALKCITDKGIEVSTLMFDGCMVYGDHYNDLSLLESIATKCNEAFPTLNMIWDYKKHDTTTVYIPEGWKSKKLEKLNKEDNDEKKKESSDALFATMSQEFEKTHTKIINDSVFVKQLGDKVIIMSKKELMTSYEHIQCGVNSNNIPVSFIQKWTSCNDNINKKDSMQIYPNPSKCPDNVFNLWRPFAMEVLTSPYQNHTEGLDMMLKHILVLCDNLKKVFDYFIGWIAMMIQKPEIKTTCITLISKEGAGKGTLMQLFAKMLGESKILETKTPSRDVWGQFNGIMADAFLVNLNEMEYKETQNAEGQIKALITDT
jgi:hypothetical protein